MTRQDENVLIAAMIYMISPLLTSLATVINNTSQICCRNAAMFYWDIIELHPPSFACRRDVWEGLIRNAGC